MLAGEEPGPGLLDQLGHQFIGLQRHRQVWQVRCKEVRQRIGLLT
jgi:hypothetical protein